MIALKEVKRLCKEFGFTDGMLKGALAVGRKKLSEEKTSRKLIILYIIEDWDWGFALFVLLLTVCVPGYTFFISDRTILKGYNESLNEAIAYPETINHLSDIRYI